MVGDRQLAHEADKLPGLRPVVFITGELVRQRVENDQFGPDLSNRLANLLIERRGGYAPPPATRQVDCLSQAHFACREL